MQTLSEKPASVKANSQTYSKATRLTQLTDAVLIERLEKLVSVERRTTAEILEVLKEVDVRRLYLGLGFTSLFAYLTDGLGYSPASAQRRIDSARLLRAVPEIKNDLETGELNLTQVSMLAQGLRQKNSSSIGADDISSILTQIKNQDLRTTQQTIAQKLDLPLKDYEVQRVQKDQSTRLEVTFSQEETRLLQRVKELISHTHPNPTWAELIVYLSQDFLKRKDPLQSRKKTSATEAAPPPAVKSESENPRSISNPVRRFVFNRDQCCQWLDPNTGLCCESRFQLQIDHIQPVWAGGTGEASNLQLLCAVHNALKYKTEAGIRWH